MDLPFTVPRCRNFEALSAFLSGESFVARIDVV
jgi:hypothetical protein